MDFSGPAGGHDGGQGGPLSPDSAPPARAEIEETLTRILTSRGFASSPRQQELLTYVVTETLEGRGDRLKEFTIAEQVFARGASFDPRMDSIVRVQASRLRSQLADFYAARDPTQTVRIEVPAGGYVATFTRIFPSQSDDSSPAAASATAPPADAGPTAPGGGSTGDDTTGRRPPMPPAPRAPSRPRPWLIAAILAPALLVLAMLIIIALGSQKRDPPASRSSGPTIFVAQYQLIAGADFATILRNGLQFELIDSLSRFRELSVLGIDTVYGSSSDAARRNDFGADFILTGSVQATPDEVRVTSQLIRSSDNTVVWSRADTAAITDTASLLGVQTRIAGGVAGELGQPYGVIQERLKEDLTSARAVSLEDYLCVLQAYDYSRHKSPAQHEAVRACLEQVTLHSPGYAPAWAKLSWMYGDEERFGFNRRAAGSLPFERARDAAQRAVLANGSSAMAHQYLSIALFHLGDDADARSEMEEALRLNPNNSETLADAGQMLVLLGDLERGRELAQKAIDTNPGAPAWYYGPIAMYHVIKGDRDDALRFAQKGAPDGSPMGAFTLAAALRLNGDSAKADQALETLYAQSPDLRARKEEMIVSLRLPAKFADLVFGK